MFARYFNHLPDELVKDILEDGFTKFNHDALSNFSYQLENKNIVFKYSREQEKLEDDIDSYSFRLPKDSYQLCEIGTTLHNCVASYGKSVLQKECAIVSTQNYVIYSRIPIQSSFSRHASCSLPLYIIVKI